MNYCDRLSVSQAPLPTNAFPVMAGLVPAIHVLNFAGAIKTWMPGTRPGMTIQRLLMALSEKGTV